LNTLPGSFKQNVLVPFGKSKESTVSLRDSSEKNYEIEEKTITKCIFWSEQTRQINHNA